MMYKTPKEFYFRIHHVRPRFKEDIENVLFFMAQAISSVGKRKEEEFNQKLNDIIFTYPGNATKTLKTINNWRTEISSLFGFYVSEGEYRKPGLRAEELAQNRDLVEFFKTYLFTFQYPGAHIKPAAVLEQIEYGIHFKPAQYILKLLRYASQKEGISVGITKFEVCHCIFNDLRCTRDNQDVALTWELVKTNRQKKIDYDQTGDVIRYAGDIIDYMVLANLLKTYDNRTYFLNTLEESTIIKFIESSEWFSAYDKMISAQKGDPTKIKQYADAWFQYVNRKIEATDFATDILRYIASDEDELKNLQEGLASIAVLDTITEDKCQSEKIYEQRITDSPSLSTKDIGDIGEGLIHAHECMRIKIGGREDLIHLIKRIPSHFAIGYDISSVELNEQKRYIEVKTTVSTAPLHFNKVHLTKNEWNTAGTLKDRYFIYRLMINKQNRKLFLLQDPVGLYKKDLIEMVPSDGADITFNPNTIGTFEELLTWKK